MFTIWLRHAMQRNARSCVILWTSLYLVYLLVIVCMQLRDSDGPRDRKYMYSHKIPRHLSICTMLALIRVQGLRCTIHVHIYVLCCIKGPLLYWTWEGYPVDYIFTQFFTTYLFLSKKRKTIICERGIPSWLYTKCFLAAHFQHEKRNNCITYLHHCVIT